MHVWPTALTYVKRTMMSQTDNTAGIWCQSKGSATSTLPPDQLLRLQAIQKKFYSYTPCHDFLIGANNGISERPTSPQDLTDNSLLAHIYASHPQKLPWRLRNPLSNLFSSIASVLRRKTSLRDSLIVEPLPPMGNVQSGLRSVETWPSTPLLIS